MSIGMIFIMYRYRNRAPRHGGIQADLEKLESLEFSDHPMASTRAIANPAVSKRRAFQAAGLLHLDQARSEPADPDDHIGGILSGLARATAGGQASDHAAGHFAGCQRHGDSQPVDGARLRRPDAAHREPAPGFGPTQCREACWFGLSLSIAGGVASGRIGQSVVRAAGDRNPSRISAGLHAAKEEDAALHAAGRRAGRHAYAHRMGGRIRRCSQEMPGCFLASSFSGSSRISWPSR